MAKKQKQKTTTAKAKTGARKTAVAKSKARTRKTAVAKSKARTRKTAVAKSKARTRKTAVAKSKARTRKTAVAKSKARTRKTTAKAKTMANATTISPPDFDFNKWLLPTLDLEKYNPNGLSEPGIKDNIYGSTRYAWIGSGQCGGRIAKSFYDLGYRKVLALNTTHNDLDLLKIPDGQKFQMDIGAKGAGKDMERGRAAVHEYTQDIFHHIRKLFGTEVEHIMVSIGAGGGTGSGSVIELIEIAKKYARSIGLPNPNKRVGAVMTLPTVGEASSPIVAHNAYTVGKELSEMAANGKISPLIIVDNEKISKLYPGMTVKSFWPSINQTISGLFDIFNRLSAMSSQYTSFDPVDYHSIMQAGNCAIMGLTKVTHFNDRFELSKAVKRNLEKTLLASGFNLASAKLVGCIVVGGRKMMANVPGLADNINYAFDVLAEITGNASIHRGIYEDNRESLRVYTIIGGLDAPDSRLEELTDRMLAVAGK